MQHIHSRKTKLFFLILITVLYVALQATTQILTMKHIFWPNGIIMTFEFGLCIGLVLIDYKLGRIISQSCLSLSLALFIYTILGARNYSAMPGVFSTIIFFIVLTILSKQFEEREKENLSDFLTGLLNERGLYRLLSDKMQSKNPFFLLGIHIQNYDVITANYGHNFGEELLKFIADDISAILKNQGTIALIKGTEFFIVMDGSVYATGLAFGILNNLSEKKIINFENNETELFLNVHAGFSKYPDDATTPDLLLKYSDIAIYHSEKIKEKISHFEPQMEESILRHMRIEKLIKSAILHDYFYLVYQPQFTLDGKKLRGFETLLRINAPHGDGVGPADFIPIAEKSDLILKIDDYVLTRAMKEFCHIIRNIDPGLTLSINVSAKNIGSPEFPSKILHLLNKTQFPAENLEIEITEYCLVQSIDIAVDNIRELRKMGIKVALDDFGTGYTSLSYLAKMPVNLLKIDKSLIDDIETNKKIFEFVNTVISLGHLMNCEVISEGVENENQLALLKEVNCDLIQGYVWGKPLKFEIAKTLTEKK